MSKPRNTPNAPRRGRNTFVASALVAASLAAGSIVACSSDAHDLTSPASPRAYSGFPTTTMQVQDPITNSWDTQQWLNPTQFSQMQASWHTSAGYTQPGSRFPQPMACNSATTSTGSGGASVTPYSGQTTFSIGRIATVTVPAGAAQAPVKIQATASVGSSGIKFDFQPHGTRFAKALTISVNYQGCTLPYSSPLNFYYVNDLGGILQTMPSSDDRSGNTIQALTDHFSGFMIAWS